MIKRVLRKCALKLLSFSELEEHPPVARHSKQAFERRGQVLMTARRAMAEPVTAGTVQLLGLDDIKQVLGAAWPKVSSRVMSLADACCYEAKNKGRDRVQVYQPEAADPGEPARLTITRLA